MFVDPQGRMLLLRRSVGHQVGSWGTPGGMLEQGETPLAAARRETVEEIGVLPTHKVVGHCRYDGDDGFSYTTFMAKVAKLPKPTLNYEHDRWTTVPPSRAVGLPLHTSLSALMDSRCFAKTYKKAVR